MNELICVSNDFWEIARLLIVMSAFGISYKLVEYLIEFIKGR
jgi:hypothetical protein